MPQKVADAANGGPYLTHLVNHRGQLSLIPPDNAGRMRQAKKKQRNVNPEDDMRFNTGPKLYKLSSSSRLPQSRSRRTERRTEEGMRDADRGSPDDDPSIPNYPPPSFDEAMSSPPISVCPSTTTYTSSATFRSFPSSSSTRSTSEQASSRNAEEYSSDADSDSDVSLLASPGSSSSPIELLTPALPGDRSRSPTPILVDKDFDDTEAPLTPNGSPGGQSGRRKLSLSPLRTLLPGKASKPPQRALTAHPYYQGRNPSSFFRSTTSLSTLAFGRSSSSPVDRDDIEPEALDSWEVVGRPTSLLLGVELAISASSSSKSPTQGLRQDAKPVAKPAEIPQPQPTQTVTSRSPPPPLLDRKIPFAKPKTRREPRRRDTAPSPLVISPVSSTSTIEGPVLTTVRTRRTHSPSPLSHHRFPIPGSPLRSGSFGLLDESPQSVLEQALNTPLPVTPNERAVEHPHISDHDIPTIPQLPAMLVTPLALDKGKTPISRSHGVLNTHMQQSFTHPLSSSSPPDQIRRRQEQRAPHMLSRPLMPQIDTQQPHLARSRSPSPTPSSTSTYTITPTHTPTQSQFGHHYLGRPLPRPPPKSSPRDMVDSTYSGSGVDPTGPPIDTDPNRCPEGLLIDFDQPVEAHDALLGTGSSSQAPARRDGGSGSFAQFPRDTPSDVPFTTAPRHIPFSNYQNRIRTESAIRAATVTEPPSPDTGLSHFTDLHMLVAQLDENEVRNGSSYNTLLTISEFMGPASPHQGHSFNSLQRSEQHGSSNHPLPSPTVGNITVDRRRVTKDGRIKVKLVMLETAVDKCGICLAQFKEGDLAAMSSRSCRHIFHDCCLRKWLAGDSKTCPSCRVKIGNF